jgi:PKD domain
MRKMCALAALLMSYSALICAAAANDPFTQFTDWQSRYQRTPSTALVDEGLALAKARRAAMLALIQADPDAALAKALPAEARVRLPAAVAAQLEEIIEANGLYTRKVTMYHDMPTANGDAGPFMHMRYTAVVMVGDRAFVRHASSVRATVMSLERLPIRGVALDGQIALADNVARAVTDADELDLAARTVANTNCTASVALFARVGDGYKKFCSARELADFNAGQTAYLESILGGPMTPDTVALNPYTSGPKTFLFIRVRFADQAESALPTDAQVQTQITGLNDFMRDFSYGQLSSVTGTITPILLLANPTQYYIDHGDGFILTEARTLATAAGFNYLNYNFETVRYVGGPGAFAGQAYVGARGMWLKSSDAGVAAHELGHNLGLLHANYWVTTNADPLGVGANSEYGNPFDRLGSGSSRTAHFTASAKARLVWLAPDRSTRMWGSGNYTLQAQDQLQLLNGPMAALLLQEKLFVPAATATSAPLSNVGRIWFEHRTQQSAFASSLHTNIDSSENWLMDLTPGSRGGKNDGGLRVGATWSEPGLGAHVTPLSIDSSMTPPRFVVHTEYGDFSANTAPTVSLTASVVTAPINSSVTFVAAANDADGNPLAYSWEREDVGVISQNSNQLTQVFATAGKARVRVVVSDMRGGVASAAVVVNIGAATTGYNLRGRVVESGAPIEGALVANGLTGANFRASTTDSDGYFELCNVPGGDVTLTAMKRGATLTPSFANPIPLVHADLTGLDFTSVSEPRFQVVVTDATAEPGTADTATVQVRRVGSSVAPAKVFFRILGNAFSGSDYTAAVPASGGPLDFAAGQTSADIVFTALANTAGERTENVIVSLFDGVDYELQYPSSGLITINGVAPPSNDTFAARTTITGSPVTFSGNNTTATLEASEPPHGPRFSGYNSLWWSWTAPADGPVIISTPSLAANTAVDVYTGTSPIALNPLGTMLSKSTAMETLTFNAIAGSTYQIAVSTENQSSFGGAFTLQIAQTAQPPGLVFANGFE